MAVNKDHETCKAVQAAGSFCVTLLAEDAPEELVNAFGYKSGRVVDKFEGRDVQTDGAGNPYLKENMVSRISCKVVDKLEIGSYILFVGQATEAEVLGTGNVLTLKAYANQQGVKIFGDIPIYVSADSADAWAGGSLFEVDGEGRPRRVAGCPPDYFSADGQLWGNPLYDWNAQAKTGYAWWIGRVRHALGLYDLLRIDHFRAFDTYWAIPADATTAREGKWEQGPGMALFRALEDALGELPIVAEDLGLLFDSVRRLLADSGLPGMKVLQFAFDPGCDSEYLPHNHIPNCVVYPGTHDNTTLKDWLATANPGELAKAKAMLGLNKEEGYVRGVIRAALGSVARLTVIPMADWLELGPEARINAPGTGAGNWQWRAEEGFDTPALARQMRSLCAVFARCSAPEPEQEKQPVQPFTHGAFLALCADQLGRPAAQLTPEADFAELGVDSFDKVGLALAIEDTFGAVISDEDLIDVKTVGQMEYLVEYLLK